MDAPFGILFLKKVELYNLVKDQRKKVEVMKKHNPFSKNPITWPVEEKILRWTYHGHKYLADPIKKTDFTFKNISTKLKDWKLLDEYNEVYEIYKQAVKQPDSIFKNMVARGFAYYKNKNSHNSIIITKSGLILGEVIYNSEKGNFFIKNAYRFFSILIDYIGTWILLILVIFTIIMSLWNIFS